MQIKRVYICLLVISTVMLGWCLMNIESAYSQGQYARLIGEVVDQSGAVMVKVEIELVEIANGSLRSTVTNDLGYYSLDQLPTGSYKLTAKSAGFAGTVISPIVLQVNQVAKVNITMKPGEVLQEVTVSEATLDLDSQTSSLGGVIPQEVNTQLPLILRDPTQLINLVPGVTSDHRLTAGTFQGVGGANSYQTRLAFTITGGSRGQAAVLIDGVDVSINAGSFASAPVVPSPDFTQEFKVMTNNLTPEFGRGGGMLNIVTRSGTNQFHGTGYEFLQNDHLNANDFFANKQGVQKTVAQRNQYGFAVGGPIRKDKTFFFADWETLSQRKALPISTRVPTSNERAGNFNNNVSTNGVPIIIYNPFDTFVDVDGRVKRRPFANNQIPSNLFNKYAQNLTSFYPGPTNPGLLAPDGQSTQIGNFAEGGTQPLTYRKWDVKIDQMIGKAHKLMGRYSHSDYSITSANVFDNVATSQSLSSRDNTQPGYNAVISWNWIKSPTLIITNSGNWSRFTDLSVNNSFGYDPTPLGGPFADGKLVTFANANNGGTVFPATSITSYAPLGNGYGQNYVEPFSNYSYQMGLTKTHTRHTFKVGFQLAVRQASENFYVGNSGQYNFTGQWTNGPDPLIPSANTGNGYADLLMGLVGTGAWSTGYTTMITSKYLSGYVQDDIRLTSKLTINLGLKYEVELPYTDRFDDIKRIDQNVPNPYGDDVGPNTGGKTINQYLTDLNGRPLLGAILFTNTAYSTGRAITTTDWSNVSPRLGVAYQMYPKLVIRGGFGRLYMLAPQSAGVTGNSGVSTQLVSSIDGIKPLVTIDNPFPFGFNTTTLKSQGLGALVGQLAQLGSAKTTTPYQWQWNVGLQYELPGNTILSVAYAASRGRRLTCPFLFCTDQIPNETREKYGTQVFDTVPNPFFGVITNPTSALSRPTVQLGQLLKRFPQYTNWVTLLPPWQGTSGELFQSTWDALEVGLQKRFSQGLSLIVAYTNSKSLTNADSFEGGYLGPSQGYQDPYNLVGERSLSSEDVSQRLVAGYVYDLPFGKGKKFGSGSSGVANQIVGGWQVSGVTSFSTGFPLPVSVTPNNTGAFGGRPRPNLISDPCLDSSRGRGEKITQYVNPSAFAAPAPLTFGNSARTLGCRADGVNNVDLSLTKFFPIKEKVNVEFRTEFFNLFNRTQLAAPNMAFGGNSFGTITQSYTSPRIIQFGLKVNF